MPAYDFRLTTVIQTLENELHLGEAFFFPEVTRLAEEPGQLIKSLELNAAIILKDEEVYALYRRHYTSDPFLDEIFVNIEPPEKTNARRHAIRLRFDIVIYDHGEDARIAFIPALGIEVLIGDRRRVHAEIEAEIRACLLRTKKSESFLELLLIQRCKEVNLTESRFRCDIRTPKQLATDRGRAQHKLVVEEAGQNLAELDLPQAFELDDVINRMTAALCASEARSILLVGPSGVGKTAAVYELVRRREVLGLGRTPFWETTGSRLVAGMSGFGMWEARCLRLWREASRDRAVVYFGNLLELMEVGKSASSSLGIAAFFRPYLTRGDFLAITECTPEQLGLLEQRDPRLVEAFTQIKVEEPDVTRGRAILLSAAVDLGEETWIEAGGLETLDRLHRRYAAYSSYPGRPLRFLKTLFRGREEGRPVGPRDVSQAFSGETGLPSFLLDESEPLDLAVTRDWFGRRVIGQNEAVANVVDLIATIKAALAKPGKPLASFLFIGPTGVGKTEMARSLAEFLFRDRSRMVRVDMSEYADPVAVSRLIGGAWNNEGLLTSRVREQPFGVVLLDEFEKAHPSFFDLLLQVLGEGRLTDSSGRLAVFSNSVVIMTSNLGAESFQIARTGFQAAEEVADRAREHYLREMKSFVRPEFFNRIDRVIPFSPLSATDLVRVARRELSLVHRRDGVLYGGLSLNIPDEVVTHLAATGSDPRYGARPLKRAVERELLVPIARAVNERTGAAPVEALARVEEGAVRVSVADRSGDDDAAKNADAGGRAKRAIILRRDVQRLLRCGTYQEVQNEIYALERLERAVTRKERTDPSELERLVMLPHLKAVTARVDTFVQQVFELEDEFSVDLYSGRGSGESTSRLLLPQLLGECEQQWRGILFSVFALKFENPDSVALGLYSENPGWLSYLGRAYYSAARAIGATVEVYTLSVVPNYSESSKAAEMPSTYQTVLGRIVELKRANWLARPPVETDAAVVGFVLAIEGKLAYPRYAPEAGIHLLARRGADHKLLVWASGPDIARYRPPAAIARRGGIDGGAQWGSSPPAKQRRYDLGNRVAEDYGLKTEVPMAREGISDMLTLICEDRLEKASRLILSE